ncbi:unnamed protein product, partial [Clonostachys byssicola]
MMVVSRLLIPLIPRLLPLSWWRPEVEARADDPEQEEEAEDRANDDARDGAAAEMGAVHAAVVIGCDDGHCGRHWDW